MKLWYKRNPNLLIASKIIKNDLGITDIFTILCNIHIKLTALYIKYHDTLKCRVINLYLFMYLRTHMLDKTKCLLLPTLLCIITLWWECTYGGLHLVSEKSLRRNKRLPEIILTTIQDPKVIFFWTTLTSMLCRQYIPL